MLNGVERQGELMAGMHVEEPYSAPPRIKAPRAVTTATAEHLDADGDRVFVSGVVVEDGPELLAGFEELDIEACIVRNTSLGEPAHVGAGRRALVSAFGTTFTACDLSGDRFRSVRQCRFDHCRLTGADFIEAEITDVTFEQCEFRLASFRMARLERVSFVDCRLSEVDAFELAAKSVSFDGSRLDGINLDRLRAERLDLRGADSLTLEGVGRLDGCLVTELQLHGLVHELAAATGLLVEQPG